MLHQKSHYILAFDTTNGFCSVCLSDREKIISIKTINQKSMQAENLLKLIEDILVENNIWYDDLSYIITSRGPGSFTAIRVGLSVIKAISIISNIEVLTITNFDLLYFRSLEQIKNFNKIYVLIDAHKDQLHVKSFSNHQDIQISKPYLINNDKIIDFLMSDDNQLDDIDNSKLEKYNIFAGNGVGIFQKQLKLYNQKYHDKEHKMFNYQILPRFQIIHIRHMCKLVCDFIKNNQISLLKNEIKPLYFRKPDAIIPKKLL